MLKGLAVFDWDNLARLIEGLLTTLEVALASIIIALVGGVALGVVMAFGGRWLKGLCRVYLESIRIIPLLVWLFLVFFGSATLFGWHLHALWASIIVFGAWGVAEMMDLTRGALTSTSMHQIQSARALGLSGTQTTWLIIFPQAFLALLPASINLFTRMIKTTALMSLIGAMELLKVGQQLIEINILKIPNASFYVYGVIFILYFALCYPLSYLSQSLEKKYQYHRG
ncbi:amino acid ABC transporter permease [Helicobacter baculiformis]|uniref:Amino acid ABC transporter permease n=1 Tax=Helicobacter baculiformis TaxID=427351 RepID=A0ABV7ZIN4_9HELI|nr:amino acid ABC transporter permease [Helicobacter baculiformis]